MASERTCPRPSPRGAGAFAAPTPAAVRGELVAPALELAARFTATLVARPQTQRTYALACARFVRWLGPACKLRSTDGRFPDVSRMR
jgi:hypothetical protein